MKGVSSSVFRENSLVRGENEQRRKPPGKGGPSCWPIGAMVDSQKELWPSEGGDSVV